ncbi:LysR family transcriptional regulator [Intrasporangium sp.]|uniref:LysR family transcriptional regulator n=1 Tax=Intrasporangium sp. TaxID=1925024 RepID=UPI003221B1E9
MTTLHQLRCFLVAYEAGSLTAAAARLGHAQPSVSEQVRILERSLGARLFERVGRGLVPTEAAHELRPHAEQALGAVAAGAQAVRAVNELETGTVRFGVFGATRLYLSGAVVLEVLRRHPGVRVEQVGRHTTDVVDQLRRGRLEAALVSLPVDDANLEVHPVTSDELVYVSASAERLGRPVSGARLGQARLALAWASWAELDVTRIRLASMVEATGHPLRARVEVEDVEIALEVSESGEADTIIGLGAIHALGDRISSRVGWVPLRPKLFERFAIVHRRGAVLSPATMLMVEVVSARLRAVKRGARQLGRVRVPG